MKNSIKEKMYQKKLQKQEGKKETIFNLKKEGIIYILY